MAKNTFLLRLVLLAGLCACGAQLHASLRPAVVAAYSSQIGIRERTGNNDGKEVEQYLASVGLSKGNPWCAAFVYWSFESAGVTGMPRSGFSPTWFTKNAIYSRTLKKADPLPADVFGIWFQSKGRIAHVGFIDAWNSGSYCITVEGNTNEAGSREGDGVYRKRRLKSQIYKIARWV